MTEELKEFYIKHLYDINQECAYIISFMREYENNFHLFETDIKTNRAVRSSLEIIGEAFSRLSYKETGKKMNYNKKTLEQITPAIKHAERITPLIKNAQKFLRFRNYIKHSYDNVDETVLWQYAQKDVPSLEKEVNSLLTFVLENHSLEALHQSDKQQKGKAAKKGRQP